MSSFVITGTSRGIGLELTKQLLELPASTVSRIYAITRGPSQGLQKLIESNPGRIQNILIGDISKEEDVQKGAAEIEKLSEGKGIDVLINNAGMMSVTSDGMASIPSDQLNELFNVNVVTAHVVTKGFLPLLEKGNDKKVVNIASHLGSLAQARTWGFTQGQSYKISKTAMSMLTVQWALDLEKKGFTVFQVNPGWLKTDMGSEYADLDAPVGVKSIKEIVLKADQSFSGKFLNIKAPGWENGLAEGKLVQYDGGEVAW